MNHLEQSIREQVKIFNEINLSYETKKKMIEDISKNLDSSKENLLKYEVAKKILNEVTKKVHDNIKKIIEQFVTTGIRTIFQEDYTFKMEMKIERKKAAVDFSVLDPDGVELDLRTDVGGGMMDLVALLLRLIIWIITPEKSSAIFVLDEPVKFLSSKYLERVSKLLEEFSDKFNVQIYMNTHASELMTDVGKRYHFIIENGKTKIEQLN